VSSRRCIVSRDGSSAFATQYFAVRIIPIMTPWSEHPRYRTSRCTYTSIATGGSTTEWKGVSLSAASASSRWELCVQNNSKACMVSRRAGDMGAFTSFSRVAFALAAAVVVDPCIVKLCCASERGVCVCVCDGVVCVMVWLWCVRVYCLVSNICDAHPSLTDSARVNASSAQREYGDLRTPDNHTYDSTIASPCGWPKKMYVRYYSMLVGSCLRRCYATASSLSLSSSRDSFTFRGATPRGCEISPATALMRCFLATSSSSRRSY
jgi:hypothetical protein